MVSTQVWIVTTSGDRPTHDIADELAEIGLTDGQVLEEVGCIVGSADDDVAAKLREVPGVIDVSPDNPVDVGPPDSDITW